MSVLEELGICTRGLIETTTPFETWTGSSVQQWQVTMQILTIGDLVEIAKLTGNVPPLEMAYSTKVYLLAKCLKAINGREIVSAEDLEEYNKAHNLTGATTISLFEYKTIFIKKLSEVVVNRLTFLYDEMSNKYVATLLGKQGIPDALDATKFNEPDAAGSFNNGEETVSNESDKSSTTT
jgi:hypothetical protein